MLRRIDAVFQTYRARVRAHYDALMGWFAGLQWYEKTVAGLIVLFATLALSVTSLGLWLVLFSVKLPFWAIATLSAFGRMIRNLNYWVAGLLGRSGKRFNPDWIYRLNVVDTFPAD